MSFSLIVLGCLGGPKENDLSGYLLSSKGSPNFIALDAGSLLGGLSKAYKRGAFKDYYLRFPAGSSPSLEIFRNNIKAYLISHAHLDHVCGLVINSQNDFPKPIFAFDPTIDLIRDHLFNGKIWPNYGSEGENAKGLYKYIRIQPAELISIPGTELSFEPFVLSHHRSSSSAFLVESSGDYLLYFGDTGSDKIENKHYLETIWERIAPLIREKKLKGILLECSFANMPHWESLYGHLNTHLLIEELTKLAHKVSPHYPFEALRDLKVIVTHIKVEMDEGPNVRTRIQLELNQMNTLHIDFIYPVQGMRIEL